MARSGRITELERQRRLAGESVGSLAVKAKYSHTYISRVEGGTLKPSRAFMKAVAKALGLPVRVVFPESD